MTEDCRAFGKKHVIPQARTSSGFAFLQGIPWIALFIRVVMHFEEGQHIKRIATFSKNNQTFSRASDSPLR